MRATPGGGSLCAPPPTLPPCTCPCPAGRSRGRGGERCAKSCAGAPWGPAPCAHRGWTPAHRPAHRHLRGPERPPDDRPRATASRLCNSALPPPGGLPGSPSSSGFSVPTSTTWRPTASAHRHNSRLNSTSTPAPEEGRGRAWSLSKTLGRPSLVSPHLPRISCLYRLCGLEPLTLPSLPRLCNRNDAEGRSEDLLRAIGQAQNSSW